MKTIKCNIKQQGGGQFEGDMCYDLITHNGIELAKSAFEFEEFQDAASLGEDGLEEEAEAAMLIFWTKYEKVLCDCGLCTKSKAPLIFERIIKTTNILKN